MVDVKILNLTPSDAIAIVHELKSQGYIQDVDFEWAYHLPYTDSLDGYDERKYTIFRLHNGLLATWFSLKYG